MPAIEFALSRFLFVLIFRRRDVRFGTVQLAFAAEGTPVQLAFGEGTPVQLAFGLKDPRCSWLLG